VWYLCVRVVVFNAALNNISIISWQSVLLVEETGVPEERGVYVVNLYNHLHVQFYVMVVTSDLLKTSYSN
jgi:hypothetical protein